LPSGVASNYWIFAVSLGYGENGKRIRRSFCGKTKDEARLKFEQHRARNGGVVGRSQMRTVEEYLETWLASVATSRRSATARFYADRIRRYALPNIGKMPLDELDGRTIAKLYQNLALRSVSADNIQKLHKSLRRAFNVAIGQGLIARNPCAFVDRPQHRPARRGAYDAEELATLFAAARGHRYEALVRLGVFAAMRPGELFALQWSDVNLEAAVVDVRHSLEERPRKLAPAKAKSARRVPLDAGTIEALERHQAAMAAEKHGSPFVFVTPAGKWLSEKVANAALALIVEKANLPPATLYVLRHSGVSLYGESGASARVAADIAGHSTTDLTLDVYTHVAPARHRESVDRAAALVASHVTGHVPADDSEPRAKQTRKRPSGRAPRRGRM
jgi:integrase